MKVSGDGRVLFQKSIMQIFIENDLGYLIFPSKKALYIVQISDNGAAG